MKLILHRDVKYHDVYPDGWGIWDLEVPFRREYHDSISNVWMLLKQEIRDYEDSQAASTEKVD